MRIHDNLLSDNDIDLLRQYWEKNLNKVYVNGYREKDVQDYRLDISEKDPEFEIVKSIIKKDFTKYLTDTGKPIEGAYYYWAALQRAYLPHILHIDDCFVDDRPAYTYIIAFDSYNKHRTLAWKKICQGGNKELFEVVNYWFSNYSNLSVVNEISTKEDIDHTPFVEDNYMLDYYEFDDHFVYNKGSGCLFNARQMHCTSNWKKYNEFEYRELLQIHMTIPDLIVF